MSFLSGYLLFELITGAIITIGLLRVEMPYMSKLIIP